MKKNNNQRGFIKEIIIVVGVIFILSYFSLDPQLVWDKIIEVFNAFLANFK